MPSEKQKYVSGIFKTFGLASFTPLATIIFQYIVFSKFPDTHNATYAVLVFLFGWIFIAGGYIVLKEK